MDSQSHKMIFPAGNTVDIPAIGSEAYNFPHHNPRWFPPPNFHKIDRGRFLFCAGKTVVIPATGSEVYYSPQVHSSTLYKPEILCRITEVSYYCDEDSDQVFAIFQLTPLTAERAAKLELVYDPKNDLWQTLSQVSWNKPKIPFDMKRLCPWETLYPNKRTKIMPPYDGMQGARHGRADLNEDDAPTTSNMGEQKKVNDVSAELTLSLSPSPDTPKSDNLIIGRDIAKTQISPPLSTARTPTSFRLFGKTIDVHVPELPTNDDMECNGDVSKLA